MTKHKTLHFFWAAFPLSLLILLLQAMPALAQRAAGKPDSVDTWSGGPSLPGPLVRAVGVFFPANGHFYAVGGRSSDTPGSDSTNPFDYNPSTNTWMATATSNVPAARFDHTAVWTGSEMIVWGGYDLASQPRRAHRHQHRLHHLVR